MRLVCTMYHWNRSGFNCHQHLESRYHCLFYSKLGPCTAYWAKNQDCKLKDSTLMLALNTYLRHFTFVIRFNAT